MTDFRIANSLLSARHYIARASDQCIVGYWMNSERHDVGFHHRECARRLRQMAKSAAKVAA